MAQLVASMSGVVLGGVVVGSKLSTQLIHYIPPYIYDIGRMCVPNSPLFQRCYMNGPIFDHFLTSLFENTHICAQIFSSETKIVIFICKLCLQTANGVYKNQRTVYDAIATILAFWSNEIHISPMLLYLTTSHYGQWLPMHDTHPLTS